ncbi:hypothetical protein NKJ52_20635 [Mesorhizobium australicum]|uniref:DUF6950 family protein n=1 Tax=Mesorhizobium australicum TaxID=536018 RepID=UPI003338997A
MTLEEYIRLPHRWQWGFSDCTLFTANWVVAATGKDPGAELRSTYLDAEGAAAILRASGGAERLVGSKLGALGFPRTNDPRDGDIGIVNAMSGFEAAGASVKEIPAIRFGPLWAVMSARGAMVKHLDWTGSAWRIA